MELHTEVVSNDINFADNDISLSMRVYAVALPL